MSSNAIRGATFLAACVFSSVVPACAREAGPGAEAASSDGAELWNGPSRFGLSLNDPASLDVGNAYWMARLSAIAYAAPAEARQQLEALGVRDAELLFFENEETDTQALYVGFAEIGILAFRGTEATRWKDLVTDARARRVDTPFGGVHAGFYDAFRSVWDDNPGVSVNGTRGRGIAAFLRERHARSGGGEPKPWFVTGHSLGGALATIAVPHAQLDACLRVHPDNHAYWTKPEPGTNYECSKHGFDPTALYSFGSPRTGDERFNMWSRYRSTPSRPGTSLFRFMNAHDLVTRVPDSGYVHACTSGPNERYGVVYLTRDGDLDIGGQSEAFLYDWKRAQYLDHLGDHGCDLYAAKLLPFAGDAPPLPQLSVRRAWKERIKAAYLAPVAPTLQPVEASTLRGKLADNIASRPLPLDGTRTVRSWSFEGATLYVLEDRYLGEASPLDGEVGETSMIETVALLFLDSDGNKLLSTGMLLDGSETMHPWYDFEDEGTRR